ncbi:MAG TPA: PRC-barrel domain-containing protein [Ktedonobacterales bacterium]|nr:PRC-barrel domain-containing protein [Ktedonobacterales bacterium]
MQQQPPSQPPFGNPYGEPTQPVGQPPPSYSEPTQPISQPPSGPPESAFPQPPQPIPQEPERAGAQPFQGQEQAPTQVAGTPFAPTPQAPQPYAPSGRGNWVSFSRLRGHPLIDILTGKTVGTVDDVLLDQQRRAIQAFLTKGSLFHKSSLVPARQANIGADAVTFQPGALAGQDTSWLEALPKASQIIGMRVLSNSGQLLGSVEELRIDPEGPSLAALELAPEHTGIPHRLGGARRLLTVNSVISYGPDTIIAMEGGLSEL